MVAKRLPTHQIGREELGFSHDKSVAKIPQMRSWSESFAGRNYLGGSNSKDKYMNILLDVLKMAAVKILNLALEVSYG